MTSKAKRTLVVSAVVAALILAELFTLYVYSLIWLTEGQPGNYGDPGLRFWEWVCILAMIGEAVAAFWWIIRNRGISEPRIL